MSTQVLICDDSSFARKQMARALPADWDVQLNFAANGAEGLEAVKAGKGEIMFLDLNMPGMDGYAVLEAVRKAELPSIVIVVSGDIQPEAYQRVLSLGALEFVKKPFEPVKIGEVLSRYGLHRPSTTQTKQVAMAVDAFDGLREIANVAAGQAADLLARALDSFILMPVPVVNYLEVSELRMALEHVAGSERISALCQGFIGAGIAGEALLVFSDSSYQDIAELMNYEGELDRAVELELLMDIGSMVIGACLKGISQQLDVNFSQSHPVVLGHHVKLDELLEQSANQWKKTLAIDLSLGIEGRDVHCNLMLLFTEDSVSRLQDIIGYLAE